MYHHDELETYLSYVCTDAIATTVEVETTCSTIHNVPTKNDAFGYASKRYLHDTHLFELDSIVESCSTVDKVTNPNAKGSYVLVLNETIFHPQGGGQPSDIGKLFIGDEMVFEVKFAQNSVGGSVELFGELTGHIESGDSVRQLIDESSRRLNARLHSSGHILDCALRRLNYHTVLKPTKGYHFPEAPYVEYELLNGGIPQVELTDLLTRLNSTIKEIVAEDIPTFSAIASKSCASELCECDTSAYPDYVRVVSVGGLVTPCGGTHIKSSAELGVLVATKYKIKKTVLKISYELH